MAEIEEGEILNPKEVESPLELANNIERAIVSLEKLRRAALANGEAIRSSSSTTEVKALIDSLVKEQEELRKVNKELQDQIALLGQQGPRVQNATRANKQYEKGIIDILKNIRIGGVSVGVVLDKLEKANTRVFSNITKGYTRATISAKLFGTAARTALTLTGIGAIIALLALVVTYWDDIASAIGLADSKQKQYLDRAEKELVKYNEKLAIQLQILEELGASETTLNTIRRFNAGRTLRLEELKLKNAAKEIELAQVAARFSPLGLIGLKAKKKAYEDLQHSVELAKLEVELLDAKILTPTIEKEKKGKKQETPEEKAERERKARIKLLTDIQTADRRSRAERDKDVEEDIKKDLGAADRKKEISKNLNKRIVEETKERYKTEEALRKLNEEKNKAEIARRQEVAFNALNITSDFLSVVDQALDQRAETRMRKLDEEENALTEYYDKLIKLAGDNLAQRSELENDFESKKADLDRKRRAEIRRTAMQEKANAMFSIIINTARAVVELITKPPLALAAGIVGAAQLAIVATQKLPSYAKGTRNHPGGLARVSEEGSEFYFNTRTGKAGFTPEHETIMDFDPGTVIVPNKKVMQGLAVAGMNGQNYSPIKKAESMGLYFRELNTTIKNKPGVEININEEGFVVAMRHAETRMRLTDKFYK